MIVPDGVADTIERSGCGNSRINGVSDDEFSRFPAETGIAVVVRDGGNARSSIALFDANEPRSLKALGAIDDGLGAISTVAIYKRHVFAVSDGHRLDVVNIKDPARSRRAGSLDLGGRRGRRHA